MSARKKVGFTLIELMVVISIIAIMSVIGLTLYGNVQKSARDAKRRSDLKAIAQALEVYKVRNGSYLKNNWLCSDSADDPWIKDDPPGTGKLDSNYMVTMPKDPINSGPAGCPKAYTYAYLAGCAGGVLCAANGAEGSWFLLIAYMENPNTFDLKSKCTSPYGKVFGSTNVSPTPDYQYNNAYILCNQQ